MKATAKAKYGSDSLQGITVAVQGLGHVGYYLCSYLAEEGAKLIVTDIDAERIRRVVDEFGAKAVAPDEIYSAQAQIFAPCALGAIINDQTLPQFRFEIIAGAANNQLAEARHGQALEQRSILYAPDYVINAGGVINVYGELHGWDADRSKRKAAEIYHTLEELYEIAKTEGIPTQAAADRLAERRIQQVASIHRTHL